jgi:hypothetical protein
LIDRLSKGLLRFLRRTGLSQEMIPILKAISEFDPSDFPTIFEDILAAIPSASEKLSEPCVVAFLEGWIPSLGSESLNRFHETCLSTTARGLARDQVASRILIAWLNCTNSWEQVDQVYAQLMPNLAEFLLSNALVISALSNCLIHCSGDLQRDFCLHLLQTDQNWIESLMTLPFGQGLFIVLHICEFEDHTQLCESIFNRGADRLETCCHQESWILFLLTFMKSDAIPVWRRRHLVDMLLDFIPSMILDWRSALLVVEIFRICDMPRKIALCQGLSNIRLHQVPRYVWNSLKMTDFVARSEQWHSFFSNESESVLVSMEIAGQLLPWKTGEIEAPFSRTRQAVDQKTIIEQSQMTEQQKDRKQDGRWMASNRQRSESITRAKLEAVQQTVRLSRGREKNVTMTNSALQRRIETLNGHLVQSRHEYDRLNTVFQLAKGREQSAQSQLAELKRYCQGLEVELKRREEFQDENLIKFLRENYHDLAEHVQFLSRREDRHCRFPFTLEPFYLLFGLRGQTFYEMIQGALGLPCWRTFQRMKDGFLQSLGFTSELFDGTYKNLRQLCQLSGISPSEEILVAVDAVAVGSYVRIDDDGTVDGMLSSMAIDSIEAQHLLRSEELFRQFLKQHQQEITKFVFVLYAIPIGFEGRPFPIRLIKANSGGGNDMIMRAIESAREVFGNLGYTCRSIAFDGDRAYLCIVQRLFTFLTERLWQNLGQEMHTLLTEFDEVFPIEDPLHLAKTDRYRRISDRQQCAYLTSTSATLDVQAFLSLGMPPSVLSSATMLKMVDELPLKMFSLKFLNIAYLQKKYDVFIALAPSTLLLSAIFRTEFSRQDRLRCLSLAAGIVWFYVASLECWSHLPMSAKRSPPYVIHQTMTKSDSGAPLTL